MVVRIAVTLFLLAIVSMLHHMFRPKKARWHDFTWEIAIGLLVGSLITALAFSAVE